MVDLKEVLSKQRKAEPVDTSRMTDREKQLVDELLNIFCEEKGEDKNGEFATNIRQRYQVEKVKEFDIEKSLWYKVASATDTYYQKAGWIDVGFGTKDAIRYPLVSFTHDIRKVDEILAWAVKNLIVND